MELEFRNASGDFLVAFKGDFAKEVQKRLCKLPELIKEERYVKGKGNFVTYRVVKRCGYKFLGVVELILEEGTYIKIVQ